MRLPKQVLAARLRADLAERRIKRGELAAWTGRSVVTIQRWVSDAPEYERYQPLLGDLILLAYLTGYPVSRYTGDERDDERFPLPDRAAPLKERVDAEAASAPDAEVRPQEH